ncbi:MAG: hypothetical protein R2762_23630 [Bryobacteraceae bacterium]
MIPLLAAGFVCAIEPPKPKPELYPAHTALNAMTLAAEYTGSSVFGRRDTYYLPNYLVIDAAVFPAPRKIVRLSSGHFRLRVNGRKALLPQPPGMVALAVNDPAWSMNRRWETTGGVGPVILGQPRRAPFPGDPTGSDPRNRAPLPRPVENEDRSGVEKEPPESMQDVVKGEALLEGPVEQAVRGYLYFPYQGKLKSVKKLELLYDNGFQTASLSLP